MKVEIYLQFCMGNKPDFLSSLTHPRKIVLVVLQIGNMKTQKLISTPTYGN
jgi:hypothetical protein